MNDTDRMYDRIDLMLEWLDLGVFYDSFEGKADAPSLPPLPDISRWDMDELEDMFYALDALKQDLNDSHPAPRSVGAWAKAALLKQIAACHETLSERIVELEIEEEERAFRGE